jgi:hypothetical protein
LARWQKANFAPVAEAAGFVFIFSSTLGQTGCGLRQLRVIDHATSVKLIEA